MAYTFVPDTLQKFMKQQFRWKKIMGKRKLDCGSVHVEKNPLCPSLLPWSNTANFSSGYCYQSTCLVSLRDWKFSILLSFWVNAYGNCLRSLLLHLHKGQKVGIWSAFAAFYTIILIWQLPWAILNLRGCALGNEVNIIKL